MIRQDLKPIHELLRIDSSNQVWAKKACALARELTMSLSYMHSLLSSECGCFALCTWYSLQNVRVMHAHVCSIDKCEPV